MKLADFYKNKTILVTGGVGSIGSKIVRKVLEYGPKAVRVLDNNETGLFNLEQELNSKKIRAFVGDIRDKNRLKMAIESVDIVFHAAALKHVPLCEFNPFEAVKTNILGTQNLIEVAIDEEVEKFVTISTDKAISPINVMGATKLLVERLTISANFYKGKRETTFSCVRFGNVLTSRGAVLSIFREQVKKGGPVTVTHPDMTRFVMSIDEATKLVLGTVQMVKGGEIFILRMLALRIIDLAKALIGQMAPKYGYKPEEIEIKIVGKRPGEKIYEELMAEEEAAQAYKLKNMFVLPSFKSREKKTKIKINEYRSDNTKLMSIKEIKDMLVHYESSIPEYVK